MRRSRTICAVLTTAALAMGAVLAGTVSPTTQPAGQGEASQGPADAFQEALKHLQEGRPAQAEELAVALATPAEGPLPRAWLVAAQARQDQHQYGPAAQAYRSFLAGCDSPAAREYANRQLHHCLSAAGPASQPAAPGAALTDDERKELAEVAEETFTESSDHFVIRARNAKFARLLAREAERALARICRLILGGQEYPHSVEIYVWVDHKDYLAHASKAHAWSGGAFTLVRSAGVVTRRIDLAQRNDKGLLCLATLNRILPHEMCHLVTAELFGDAPCPLFLNEGLATFAEWEVDNDRLELAGMALASQGRIPLTDLLALDSSQVNKPGVFYSESYSLVGFLRRRLTDRQFADLLEHLKNGCAFADALQRALHAPDDPTFLPALASAWEKHAVQSAQLIRALRGGGDMAPPLP